MDDVSVQMELEPAQAMALAQLVKRIGWDDMRQLATSEPETYQMKYALAELQKALAAAGYAPR